jgi:hypothetical protein
MTSTNIAEMFRGDDGKIILVLIEREKKTEPRVFADLRNLGVGTSGGPKNTVRNSKKD